LRAFVIVHVRRTNGDVYLQQNIFWAQLQHAQQLMMQMRNRMAAGMMASS
jgi:hypothetical protein